MNELEACKAMLKIVDEDLIKEELKNRVIISRLKALERYEIEADTIWDNKDGNITLWADIQAIIEEFEERE